MKHTDTIYKLFKYFESNEVTFKYLLKSLQDIGWLQPRETYKKGMKNLMKIGSKQIHSDITEYQENELLEFTIDIKGVGIQIIGFKITPKKTRSVLEMAMKIDFFENFKEKEKKSHFLTIKNGFSQNAKNIDTLIRNLFEANGFKSYY